MIRLRYVITVLVLTLTFFVAMHVTNAQVYVFNNNLKVGDAGADVAALQTWLMNHGFDIPSISGHAASYGYFGRETQSALMRYQVSASLPGTGYFGPLTRASFAGSVGYPMAGGPLPVDPATSTLRITSPNGGEVWTASSTEMITWQSSPDLDQKYGNIYLEYPVPQCNNPNLYKTLRCNMYVPSPIPLKYGVRLGQDSYTWTVGANEPSIAATTSRGIANGLYKISLCDSDKKACDESDAYFIIGRETAPGAPVIFGVQASTTLSVGQSGVWTVNAADPGGGQLGYIANWGEGTSTSAVTGDQIAPSYTSTPTFNHAYFEPGNYTVTFTVKNQAGMMSETSVPIHVLGDL